MTHLFEKRDPWGHRLSLWIIVLMAFVTPVCGWSLRHLQIENDVENWLPSNDPERQALRAAHVHFPMAERVVLTWDGSSINDARIGKLVDQLMGHADPQGIKRGGTPYVSSITQPSQSLLLMQQNGVSPQEAARRLEGTLLGAGPMRLRLTDAGRISVKKTKRELQTAFKKNFGTELEITDATPDLTPLVMIPTNAEGDAVAQPSPPAILSVAGQLIEGSTIEHDLQVSWKGIRVGDPRTIEKLTWMTEFKPDRNDGKPLVEGAFFAIGSPIALEIELSNAGLSDKTETLNAIQSACRNAGIPLETLHLTGTILADDELNIETANAVWNPPIPLNEFHRKSVVLSSILVCSILAFAMLRNLKLATIAVLVSGFTAFCTLAIIPLTGGATNLVVLVVPTVLFAMTISGSIYFVNVWKSEACKDETRAIIHAVRITRIPCFLSCFIMAVASASLCTSRLAPLREFGFYAAFGSAISMLMIMFGLPALMQQWSVKLPRNFEIDRPGWTAIGKSAAVHSGWQAIGTIAICLGIGFGLSRFQIDSTFLRFPDRSQIVRDNRVIEANLTGIMPIETIIQFDEQAQKETNFLDRMEIVRTIQNEMRSVPEVTGAICLASFHAVNEPISEDAGFIQKSRRNKHSASIQQQIQEAGNPISRSYHTIAVSKSPANASTNDLGDELWRISANISSFNEQRFPAIMNELHRSARDVLRMQPGATHQIVGTIPQNVRMRLELWPTLVGTIGLSIFAALVIFAIAFRSIWHAIMAMTMPIASISVTLGLISWCGQSFDLSEMIVIPIAIGMTSQGAVFFVNRVLRSMNHGQTRQDAIINGLVHCGPAIAQATFVVSIGLLALLPAQAMIMSRFGWLMASMVGVAFLGQLFLLPQLISCPLGRLMEPAKSSIEPAKPAIVAPVLVAEPVVSPPEHGAAAQATPAPHIKRIEGSRKKRRPTG